MEFPKQFTAIDFSHFFSAVIFCRANDLIPINFPIILYTNNVILIQYNFILTSCFIIRTEKIT